MPYGTWFHAVVRHVANCYISLSLQSSATEQVLDILMGILSWEIAEVVSPCLPRGLWSHNVIRWSVFLLLGTVCLWHPPYPVLPSCPLSRAFPYPQPGDTGGRRSAPAICQSLTSADPTGYSKLLYPLPSYFTVKNLPTDKVRLSVTLIVSLLSCLLLDWRLMTSTTVFCHVLSLCWILYPRRRHTSRRRNPLQYVFTASFASRALTFCHITAEWFPGTSVCK